MGSDFCSCLSDITSPESENLSRGNDINSSGKKIDNHPKVVLNKNNTIDSVDPLSSTREREYKSTMSSTYKNSIVSLRNSNYKQNNQKEKQNIVNLKNNLNNKKKNSNNKNKNNGVESTKNDEKKHSVKNLNKNGFVSENFKNFFNTQKGQEMTLNIND
jgi:hypothetical protein